MTVKLPTKKGERAVVWQGFEDGAEGPSRIVAVSDGKYRWSMVTETAMRFWEGDEGEADAEAWEDGRLYTWDAAPGVGPAALFRVMVEMGLALREYLGFVILPDVASKIPAIIDDGEHVIAKIKGNRCLIVDTYGSSFTGEPIVGIRTNKPLNAGQWVAALRNLAKTLDAYESEHGDG